MNVFSKISTWLLRFFAPRRKMNYEIQFDSSAVSLIANESEQEWTFNWNELVYIAVGTLDADPWFDDYFLIFKTSKSDELLTASLDYKGCSELFEYIEREYLSGLDSKDRLANCTHRASKILWPPELAGRPVPEWTQD